MRKTFITLFLADVGAPFQARDFRDLLFQRAKSIFDLFDILGGGRAFELEADHVVDLVGRLGDGGDSQQREGE